MTPVLLVGTAVALVVIAAVLLTRTTRAHIPTGRPTPSPAAAGGGVVGHLARHRWARRTLGGVSIAMVLVAVGVAGYPIFTDRYTETLQTKLEQQLLSGETRTAYLSRAVEVGDSLTRIKIPSIGVDTVVVEGTTESALRAGAGHFPETPLPCETGNVAIAGHRSTYGKPFADLHELAVGDEITLETPIGSCTYEVAVVPFEVDPGDVWVADPTEDARLTLTTCHPQGSDRQRLVLQATLASNDQDPLT